MHTINWIRINGIIRILAFTVVATLITTDASAFLDPDLDNSLPIEAIDPKIDLAAKDNEPVQVIVKSRTRDSQGNWKLECLLLNKGKVPIYYSGYLPTSFNERPPQGQLSPLEKVQERQQVEWKDVRIRSCGFGRATLRLQPGQGGQFFVYRKNSQHFFRIGIPYAVTKEDLQRTVVWSAETPVMETQ